MQKIWKIKEPNLELQKQISQALNVSGILAQMLINRGVTTVRSAEQFFKCDLASLGDPFHFKGMEQAAARIRQALRDREKIMVWGDYDIDGITATALLISLFRGLGADVCHYLPNRLEEGYGLNNNGALLAKKKGVTLLITVDCGISACEQIRYLNELGIDTIITDHHQPKEETLPPALAIINPLQQDCPYPYKYLSGVGVAAKLAAAILGSQDDILKRYLELITLGTVGDIVSLNGENRVLVKHGLEGFSRTRNLGLRALMDVSGLANQQINARHIGYVLGPRINASGRLGSPEDSLRLLLAEKQDHAYQLAEKLSQGNRLRQRIANRTFQEAIAQVERQINFKEHNIIVLGAPNWHRGVIGIVASRLVERYLRPAIIMTLEDEFGRGSGRSIGGFHLLDAVRGCEDLLEEYGGHKRACGVKVRRDKFSEFFEKLNLIAKETLLPEDLTPAVEIEIQIPLSNLNERLIAELDTLAPFGMDNPKPLICSSEITIKSRPVTVGGNHIKFWVTDGRLTCEAIGYNKAESFPGLQAGERIALVYSPSINNWQGNSSIQLEIEDLKTVR